MSRVGIMPTANPHEPGSSSWVSIELADKRTVAMTPAAREIAEMIEGCSFGHVRESWALRIVQMGADVARNEAARWHLEESVRDTGLGLPASETATTGGGGTEQ